MFRIRSPLAAPRPLEKRIQTLFLHKVQLFGFLLDLDVSPEYLCYYLLDLHYPYLLSTLLGRFRPCLVDLRLNLFLHQRA